MSAQTAVVQQPEINETNTANNNDQEQQSNLNEISNAANSMQDQQQIYPQQIPMVPATQIPTTLDDFINTSLNIEEKRKLRFDLLSLPPEKLGEIMYVLQKSQPQNIEQIGDELEIDLKKLNTKTLRHLQRYVESVFAKVRYNSMLSPMPQTMPHQQQMFIPQQQQMMNGTATTTQGNVINPWGNHHKLTVGDLIPNQRNRKRTYQTMAGSYNINGDPFRNQRKKRSAFTSQQKEDMIKFWKTVNWQAIPDDNELEIAGNKIGVTVAQLKVFRQNNRKKYGDKEQNDQTANNDTTSDANKSEVVEEQIQEDGDVIEIEKVDDDTANADDKKSEDKKE